MRILIVDDEAMARQRLCRILADIMPEAVLTEAGNGLQALQVAQELLTDIVLLDIRMPGMDGIEAAGHLSLLSPPPAVIFTTAYEKHAMQAFAAHAVGYLLKPVQAKSLYSAITHAKALNQLQLNALKGRQARRYISGDSSTELLLLPIEDVRYLLAENKYLIAATAEHKIIVNDSLSRLEQEFADDFIRVHRNALAANRHIQALHREKTGRWSLQLHGIDENLTVSRRMLPHLRHKLQA